MIVLSVRTGDDPPLSQETPHEYSDHHRPDPSAVRKHTGAPAKLDRQHRNPGRRHHCGPHARSGRHAGPRRRIAHARDRLAATMALVVFFAATSPERDRAGWPCQARRLFATGAAAQAHVGRWPTEVVAPKSAALRRCGATPFGNWVGQTQDGPHW